MVANADIAGAIMVTLQGIFPEMPARKPFAPGIRRAPRRDFKLSGAETELALKNALRYVPEPWHAVLAPEFLEELITTGRIYAYRFRPEGSIKGKPIDHIRNSTIPVLTKTLFRNQIKSYCSDNRSHSFFNKTIRSTEKPCRCNQTVLRP